MAKGEKSNIPPRNDTLEITPPRALVPLMQAFHVDSEEAAHFLILEAAKAIVVRDDNEYNFVEKRDVSKEEIEAISSLMKGLKPRDTLETLYAAQIVASHMLGMRKLSSSHNEDQKLGLNLLRFSNAAMLQLEKKRNGGTQNITVNYNYNGQGNAFMQTVIPNKQEA